MEKLKKIFENRTTVLILIVSLDLILRIIRALEMNRYDVDCYIYFNMAINWVKYGAEYAYQYGGVDYCPPLLPCLMSLGYKLGFQPEATGTFIGILLGSIIPLCMFYIVNTLFKRSDLALLAAFLGAIHPSLVRISVRCLRDSLYIPLVAIALVCAVSAIKSKSIFKWCLFSIVAALACYSRYEGVELILIFLVWFLVEIVLILYDNLFRRSKIEKPIREQQVIQKSYFNYHILSFFLVISVFSFLMFLEMHLLHQTIYRNNVYSTVMSWFNP